MLFEGVIFYKLLPSDSPLLRAFQESLTQPRAGRKIALASVTYRTSPPKSICPTKYTYADIN